MSRVLITGAAGQVGRELVEVFSEWDVVAHDHASLDLADEAAVRAAVEAARPDVVVNAAAWTDVDGCESDPARAELINGTAVGWLAEAADEVGARLCQISTDYVFDGTAPRPYREDDEPAPRSVYGRSKLVGERAAGAGALVARTSWVFGRHGRNVVRTVLDRGRAGSAMRFVDDQVGCATEAHDLAATIRSLVDDGRSGIVHVTNDEALSWYDFARRILAVAGLDPDVVSPITTAELDPPRPAPRPANSVLDGSLLRSWEVTAPGSLDDALARVVPALLADLEAGSPPSP